MSLNIKKKVLLVRVYESMLNLRYIVNVMYYSFASKTIGNLTKKY